MTDYKTVPVITIDGPTASGKGTVAQRVAQALGWAMLDSGALYRLTALACRDAGVATTDEQSAARIAAGLDVRFEDGKVFLKGTEVSDAIRAESIGVQASQVATLGAVRQALLERQRAFRQPPGLVADGRDMGTVVFPEAPVKVFLVADVHARAQRRCKQLIDKGFPANLADLTRDLEERDARDRSRAHAPLVAAPDAVTIDSSNLSIEETVNAVLDLWSGKGAQGA
ncbi:MAG: (d)CMP kinase [Alcaligenaceae bacterium]|nr:(d)CMP kinase [Alcaligenaceae bacterium]